MSYKKLDEGNSIGIGYQDTEGHHHLLSQQQPSLSLLEQHDNRASLSEPLTNATNGGNNSVSPQNDDRIYDNPSDPFFVFRQDLQQQLSIVDEELAEYLRVVYQTDSAANSYELKDVKKQLKRHIKNAESTLNDVSMIVKVVENDRTKFANISDKELYDRTALVSTSRERLIRAKNEMNSDAVKAKLIADERAKTIRRAGGNNNNIRNSLDMDEESQSHQHSMNNNDHNSSGHVSTSLLLQHQDEALDELGVAVTRVNHMAETIHDELGQQNKLLTEIDEDLTNVEEELGVVMGKLAKLLKTKDGWQLGTVLCLSGTVVVLLLLVLYT